MDENNNQETSPIDHSASSSNEPAEEQPTRLIEGDTYSISDNHSTTDKSVDEELNQSFTHENDLLTTNTNGHPTDRPGSTSNSRLSSKMSTMKSSSHRSFALDEHIKLVKQKKEEAEILRLQRVQEQLRKKEQKWQQQQLERVKKWLQLRNRDTDHRTQVEERRKKREEEAKAKIEELIRREKEREQRMKTNTTHSSHKPESMMTMSTTEILSTRRAISASRVRANPLVESTTAIPLESSTNGQSVAPVDTQRRNQSVHRTNINETTRRLAKPRTVSGMAQSIHVAGASSMSNGLPISRSSHQLRVPTPPVTTTQSHPRRPPPHPPLSSRPVTIESRASPSDESARSDHRTTSENATRPKTVPSASTKAVTLPSSSRAKPLTKRSVMTTSHSSSSLSSATNNIRRIGGTPSPKPVVVISPVEIEEAPPVTEEEAPIVVPILAPAANVPMADDEQEYQRKLTQKIREAQQRLEVERQREEERQRQLELEEYEREQEQIRLVEEQRRVEQERLQRAIEERDRENELKRQEELRLQQQREELERRQAEEAERLQRERQERAKKEEEERNERKKRLDLIMRRTRQVSPTSTSTSKIIQQENKNLNGDEQNHLSSSPMTHSMSESRFPSSTSSENFLAQQTIPSPTPMTPTDTPKFKSPLIQSLLNKARNTRSTDNLIQSSMTSSQLMSESLIDPLTSVQSNTPINLSDDDGQTTTSSNGHSDLHLSSSTNSYHDRPMETATASH